jgi:peroxiredoxin
MRDTYLKHLVRLLPVLVVAGLLAGCGVSLPQVGRPAPELSLPDTGGQAHSLEEFRGQIVVLNFWSTWCLACVEEMPILEEIQEQYGGENLVVVLVALENDVQETAEFLEENDISLLSLVDEQGRAERAYGIGALPTTLIIDPQGNVGGRRVGSFTHVQEVEEMIADALP